MKILKQLAVAATVALTAPTVLAQTWEINIGHVLSERSSYQAGMEHFARRMDEATGGAFKVNIFPSAGLGGELRLVQGGMTGTVDAFIIGQPSLEATIPQFKVLSLPYLFDSEEQAVELLRGEFGQKFLDLLPQYNMVGLGWAGVFTRGIPATQPVRKVEDLAGLKIRVMQSPGYVETYNRYGSQPTPIAFGELFMALQNRVVDATDLSPDLVISGQFIDAITHYSLAGTHQLPSLFIMSKARFDSFPSEIQTLVREAGEEATWVAIEAQRAAMADGLDQMRAAGIEIIEPDLEGFRTVGQSVWPQILADVPDADTYLDALRQARGGN